MKIKNLFILPLAAAIATACSAQSSDQSKEREITNGCPLEFVGRTGQYSFGSDSLKIKTDKGNFRKFEFNTTYELEDLELGHMYDFVFEERGGNVVLIKKRNGETFDSIGMPTEGCLGKTKEFNSDPRNELDNLLILIDDPEYNRFSPSKSSL